MPNLKNLISEDIGNFRDCIDNIVYNLQRYADQLIHYIPDHAMELSRAGFNKETLGFLIGESDNILRHQIAAAALESHVLLNRKLSTIIKIIKNSTASYNFYFSYGAELWFRDYNGFNDVKKDPFSFHEDPSSIDETIYNYVDRLDMITKEYDARNYGSSVPITKENLLERLESVQASMQQIMTGLRQSIDLTTSCYSASLFINVIIEYMSCIYYVISHMIIVRV